MKRTDRDVSEFLDSLPEDSRGDMKVLDEKLSVTLAGMPRELYEGKFWGGTDQQIIGYGRTTSTRSDGQTSSYFLVGLALQKNYISVYISAVEDREYVSEKYGKGIEADGGKVKVGKSSISFKSLDDIDLDKLAGLAEKARDVSEPEP
jgi:hypothetical protein